MTRMLKGFGPACITSADPGPLPLIPNLYARENQYTFSVAMPSTVSLFTFAQQPTTTVTVKIEEATTIILSPTTTTVTAFVTISASPNTPYPSSSTPTQSVEGLGPARDIWVAPTKMDDLTPFGVAVSPGGRKNLKIVTEDPANANVVPTDSSKPDTTKSDDSTSIFQILFPAGSSDPARRPQGGADFYATPLDISSAQNVTLRYRVFFPADFDWVLAGKLPGLYGGHTGCSGGNPALDCFSTRLMWRKEGAGELYLYAPKDKQTEALCSSPGSICDTTYGLSIGRGSFTWTPGNWTTVQQTVVLNTPGMQDGSFMLDVNGRRVIDRADVLYLADKGDDDDPPPAPSPKKPATSTKRIKPTSTSSSGSTEDDGGLLGGLLHGLGLRDLEHQKSVVSTPVTADHVPTNENSLPVISPPYTPNHPQLASTATASLDTVIYSSSNVDVGFIGIFFSTFFGGHGDKYATPRDQYIWFKDFALAYNS